MRHCGNPISSIRRRVDPGRPRTAPPTIAPTDGSGNRTWIHNATERIDGGSPVCRPQHSVPQGRVECRRTRTPRQPSAPGPTTRTPPPSRPPPEGLTDTHPNTLSPGTGEPSTGRRDNMLANPDGMFPVQHSRNRGVATRDNSPPGPLPRRAKEPGRHVEKIGNSHPDSLRNAPDAIPVRAGPGPRRPRRTAHRNGRARTRSPLGPGSHLGPDPPPGPRGPGHAGRRHQPRRDHPTLYSRAFVPP